MKVWTPVFVSKITQEKAKLGGESETLRKMILRGRETGQGNVFWVWKGMGNSEKSNVRTEFDMIVGHKGRNAEQQFKDAEMEV